jgi:hypothetical protein
MNIPSPSICLPTAMPRAEVPPDDEWSQAGYVQLIFQTKSGKPTFYTVVLFSLFGSRFQDPLFLVYEFCKWVRFFGWGRVCHIAVFQES